MADESTKPKATDAKGEAPAEDKKSEASERAAVVRDRASSTASEEVVTATKAGYEIPKVDPLNRDPERIAAVIQALTKNKTPEQPVKISPEQTKATVDALSQITGERERKLLSDTTFSGGEYSYSPPFNAAAFKTFMSTKNEQERIDADAEFKKQYGKSLEDVARANLSGAELADVLKGLRRKDGDTVSQRADDISLSMQSGASGWGFEKNIRDIYSSSTKAQIEQMDQRYRAEHPGQQGGLYDAIMANPKVSEETKSALKLLKNGADNRTPEESIALAQIGLNKKDIGFFQEAMAKASPEARARFLQNGGAEKIQSAFGATLYQENGAAIPQSTTDSRHALDFAKYGKLSAATQIKDNTGAVGLTTNDKGIELAVNSMNETERKLYMTGKRLAEQPNKPIDGLSPTDQAAAQAYYKELHDAITRSSNPTNVLKLEDMIATRGGGFIASLAQMRGMVYNSSVEDIRKSIQSMSQKDWQELRAHPERREDVEKILRTLKGEEDVRKLMAVYDAKLNPSTENAAALKTPAEMKPEDRLFALSQDAGKQPILDSSKENAPGILSGGNSRGTIDALRDMSLADQTKYRSDSEFRAEIDKRLAANITNPELLRSAQRLLERVKAGESPTLDVVGRMLTSTDQKQTIRDLAKAFQDDPSLRERLLRPQTPADKQFSDDFKSVVQSTLSLRVGLDGSVIQNDYTKYTDELLKNGRIPIEKMADLERGLFSADSDKLFDHLARVTPEEKRKLQTDPAYQDRIFSGLNAEQRKVAMAVVEQGELKPEDKIRMSVIGWFGGSDVAAATKAMKPEELAQARSRYAAKYGGDFDNDVLNKTSGQDKFDVKRALAGQLSFDERLEALRKEGIDTRSGFGAWAADKVSATGSQADNALEQLGSEYTRYKVALSKGITDPRQISEFQERAKSAEELTKTALDNHRESKSAAADTATDVAIGVVGVGSVIASGGTSIPLVAGLGLSMGLVKVGTKAAMMGNDYEGSQAIRDFTAGVVGGASSVLGPAELAAIFRVGSRAANSAVMTTLQDAGATGLKAALKPAAEKELQAATETLVRQALTSGAVGVEPRAIQAAADAAISPLVTGPERAKLVSELASKLQTNLETQWKEQTAGLLKTIKNQVIEQGYNAGAGAAGASAMSVTQDLMEGKSTDEIVRDALTASLTGGVTALAVANAMKWGGRMLSRERVERLPNGAIADAARDVSPPHFTNDQMVALWDQQLASNHGEPLRVVKGHYQVSLRQVDVNEHPNGLLISTTESKMKFLNDVSVRYPDGNTEILKAGTELPNGMQISPGSALVKDAKSQSIVGGKLISIASNGDVVKQGEITGTAMVQSGSAVQAGHFVVARPSVDLNTGVSRIDTYFNANTNKWVPIEGKPNMYSPKIGDPVQVIKVPEKFEGTFDVSYGGTAIVKPGDLIVRENKVLEDGTIKPGFYRISQSDALETYRPTDAASKRALDDSVDSLKKQYPEISVPRAAANQEEFERANMPVFKGSDGVQYKHYSGAQLPASTGSFEVSSAQHFKVELPTQRFMYEDASGRKVVSARGDYRLTRSDGKVYAESPSVFKALYAPRPGMPDTFSIKPGIRAQQLLDNSAMDSSISGFQTARQGEWLITGANGEKHFFREGQFKQRFSAKPINPGTEFGYYLKSLPIKAEPGEAGKPFLNPDAARGAKPEIIQKGDMIATPIGQAPYLIPADYFKKAYIDLPNGEWARTDLTMAQVLKKPETIWSNSRAGLTEGAAGDYLITRADGGQEILSRKKFDEQFGLYAKGQNPINIAKSSERFTPEVIRPKPHEVDIDGEKLMTSPVHLSISQGFDESGRFPLGLSADTKTGELHLTFAHMSQADPSKAVTAPLREIRDGLEIRVNGRPLSSNLRESRGAGDPEFVQWKTPGQTGSSTVEINFYGRRIGLYSWNPDNNILMKLDSSKSLSAFDIRQFHAVRNYSEQWKRSGTVIDPTSVPANQIDLHTHFAGSMRAETIMEIAQKGKVAFPTETLDKAGIKYHADAVKTVNDKPSVVLDPENFPAGALEKLKSKLSIPEGRKIDFDEMEAIYGLRTPAVKDLSSFPAYLNEIAKDYQRQGVRYAELSLSDVLKPEWLAAAKASLPEIEKQTGVKLRFIVGMWRLSSEGVNEELAKRLIALGKEPYVIGADFMGHEINRTLSFAKELKMLAEFRKTRPEFQIRVHAGENPMNLANIREAIELGATRIGHGVYGVDDATLALAKKHNVIIEFQTNSNLALSNIDGTEQLPVKNYLRAGVRVSLGTDGHGLYQTSARSEEAVMKSLGLTEAELRKITESDQLYTEMMERATAVNARGD